MELFTIIDDAFAIMHGNGVYKQAKLYRRGKRIYAAHGAGFIGLRTDGATSIPNARWEELSIEYNVGWLGVLEFVS